MALLIYLAILLTIVTWAIQSYRSKKSMRDAVKNIGGPFAVPILGCIHLLAEINPQSKKKE